MSLGECDALLSALADEPSDYQRQANLVMLLRQGREIMFELRELPGAGLCVAEEATTGGSKIATPLRTFIQRDILGLPTLASQIVRALGRAQQSRPGKFVQGPAELVATDGEADWPEAGTGLREQLVEAEAGATRLIQLMAPAGQGKTVLLENVAEELGRSYQPEPFPLPILLTVDLLGRYVGTIDDAIAGSLANTYRFPGLTQRDVSLCIRQRWLILALDGFDELVARVGARESFNRITELLDQLDGSGTLILSARQSFFELYQISAAIRTYLQPRRGSYTTLMVHLRPWTDKQGTAFFSGLGSTTPEADFRDLREAFQGDEEIVLHPFFLTRLAKLWVEGERFTGAGALPGQLARAKYVIDRFIERESVEKWVDRDQRPFLSAAEHTEMLGAVAEEMWRSGAFRVDPEELRLAAEIGLSELTLSKEVVADSLARVPMHAAFTLRDRRYTFVHDQFLYYFLGFRLSKLLLRGDQSALRQVLSSREVSPDIVTWASWWIGAQPNQVPRVVELLCALLGADLDGTLASNAARLTAGLLDGYSGDTPLRLEGHTFIGDVLKGKSYNGIEFDHCQFWHLDLSGTKFLACVVKDCQFGDVRIDANTGLARTSFAGTTIDSVEMDDGTGLHAPQAIERLLSAAGATFPVPQEEREAERPSPVSDAAICIVERLVKASQKTCDVAIEEMEQRYGHEVRSIARAGLDNRILKEVSKKVSGPKRTFVRFCVDRDALVRGQRGKTGIPGIDAFWVALAEKHPRR